jgi:hypothetical protein
MCTIPETTRTKRPLQGAIGLDRSAKVFAGAFGITLMMALQAAAETPSTAKAPVGGVTMLADAGQVGGKAAALTALGAPELTPRERGTSDIGAEPTAPAKSEAIDPIAARSPQPVQPAAGTAITPSTPAVHLKRAAQAELYRKALATPRGRQLINEAHALFNRMR